MSYSDDDDQRTVGSGKLASHDTVDLYCSTTIFSLLLLSTFSYRRVYQSIESSRVALCTCECSYHLSAPITVCHCDQWLWMTTSWWPATQCSSFGGVPKHPKWWWGWGQWWWWPIHRTLPFCTVRTFCLVSEHPTRHLSTGRLDSLFTTCVTW